MAAFKTCKESVVGSGSRSLIRGVEVVAWPMLLFAFLFCRHLFASYWRSAFLLRVVKARMSICSDAATVDCIQGEVFNIELLGACLCV